jgi:hypothetical protein
VIDMANVAELRAAADAARERLRIAIKERDHEEDIAGYRLELTDAEKAFMAAEQKANARPNYAAEAMHHLTAALDHEDLNLLAVAADALADSFTQVDRLYPDPEHRGRALRLRVLAGLLGQANQVRRFIDTSKT